jgi:hypothetical protein
MSVVPAYSELLELAWVTPIAVIVVAVSYSLFLLGVTRSTETRKDGHAALATAYYALAAASGLVFAGTVVAGIWVIVAG